MHVILIVPRTGELDKMRVETVSKLYQNDVAVVSDKIGAFPSFWNMTITLLDRVILIQTF